MKTLPPLALGQPISFNGTVLEGTWHKLNRESQIVFKNQQGEEIKLKPGRIWLSAIHESYGKITYD